MDELDWAYAAWMLAAVGTCGYLWRRNSRALPLAPRERWGVGLGAFCGAMIGSKLPFVLADWEGLMSGDAWLANGKTILFGIVGGYFGVEVAKWVIDLRVKTGDAFAVPVAVGVALGRVACFQAGCCYGTPTDLPWGVRFATGLDDPAMPRHPTQLYEAVFHGFAALVLLRLQKRNVLQGQRIKLYLLLYLGYRFVSEFVRPEPRGIAGLTGYQWATLALVPYFIGLWVRDARRGSDGRRSELATAEVGTP